MGKKIALLLARAATAISPKLYIVLSYLHNRGRLPNLKNPKNVSEIILSTMFYGKVNQYSDYVDKIKVRDFYYEMGYEEYLPKIYGVWDIPEEIDFKNLPSAFALKTNHGCGDHYICKDKNELNIENAKTIISRALNKKYGLAETQYHSIKPMVFCEEFIDDGSGGLPIDYKYLCVDGEVKCILVVTERTENNYKLSAYNTDWKRLSYIASRCNSEIDIPKPKNIEIMTSIARRISELFEFVRVDFYDLGYRVILGELTFTPQGGILSNFSNAAISEMGRK